MKNNDNYYIREAFNRLKCLDEEVFDLSVDSGKLDDLRSFVKDDIEAPFDEYVIERDAETVDDLRDNNLGRIVTACESCGAKVYTDTLVEDEQTGKMNVDVECPNCGAKLGYFVVGKIVPFENKEVEENPEVNDIEDGAITDDIIQNALKEELQEREICPECGEEECECDESCENDESLSNSKLASDDSKKLDESIEEVEVKTEDGEVEVEKEDNKITIEFKEENKEENGLEQIAPLSDEDIREIENGSKADIDLEVEEPIEDDENAEEGDIDDFDEEGFENISESFLTRVYDNVKSFRVNEVKENENKGLVIEGLITFESGKQTKTSFVFENAKKTKRGKTLFEGRNTMFSKSNKAFLLKGNVSDNSFVCESLTYNYNASNINESNQSETIRVYGRVVR